VYTPRERLDEVPRQRPRAKIRRDVDMPRIVRYSAGTRGARFRRCAAEDRPLRHTLDLQFVERRAR
jgi:hypothetical protein